MPGEGGKGFEVQQPTGCLGEGARDSRCNNPLGAWGRGQGQGQGNHWVPGGGGKGFEVQQPTGWGKGKGITGCLGEGARELRWYTSNNPLGEEAGQGNHWVPGGRGRARESLGAWGQGKGITGCLGEGARDLRWYTSNNPLGAGQGNHWVPGGGGRARESLGAWGRGQGI